MLPPLNAAATIAAGAAASVTAIVTANTQSTCPTLSNHLGPTYSPIHYPFPYLNTILRPAKVCTQLGLQSWLTSAPSGYMPTPSGRSSSSHMVWLLQAKRASSRAICLTSCGSAAAAGGGGVAAGEGVLSWDGSCCCWCWGLPSMNCLHHHIIIHSTAAQVTANESHPGLLGPQLVHMSEGPADICQYVQM